MAPRQDRDAAPRDGVRQDLSGVLQTHKTFTMTYRSSTLAAWGWSRPTNSAAAGADSLRHAAQSKSLPRLKHQTAMNMTPAAMPARMPTLGSTSSRERPAQSTSVKPSTPQ